jgi:hypothetical protein
VTSKVGSDGILHLDLPLGLAEADKEVQVIVEPSRRSMTQEEWRNFILSTAGKWEGEFELPPKALPEEREPLS